MTQTHIILVRHGEAASSWSEHHDPGLSADGIAQADRVSKTFGEKFLSYKLCSSPKSRAIETMKPIALEQAKEFIIQDIFSEIPSHDIQSEHKHEWLQNIFQLPLEELPESVKVWRQDLIQWLESCADNAIITTHFMVINALVSYLTKQNTIAYFHPGYTSRTEIWLKGGSLIKLKLGDDKKTVINL